MYKEPDVVRLKRDIPGAGIKAGQIGAIVMVYDKPSRAYEVEFTDCTGSTLALLTLQEQDIESVDLSTTQHLEPDAKGQATSR